MAATTRRTISCWPSRRCPPMDSTALSKSAKAWFEKSLSGMLDKRLNLGCKVFTDANRRHGAVLAMVKSDDFRIGAVEFIQHIPAIVGNEQRQGDAGVR